AQGRDEDLPRDVAQQLLAAEPDHLLLQLARIAHLAALLFEGGGVQGAVGVEPEDVPEQLRRQAEGPQADRVQAVDAEDGEDLLVEAPVLLAEAGIVNQRVEAEPQTPAALLELRHRAEAAVDRGG